MLLTSIIRCRAVEEIAMPTQIIGGRVELGIGPRRFARSNSRLGMAR